ncbi:hypothetical protein INR49_009940 [Caranx melampygus]|nr:hypothetical protein INR49_009940 [Caranx melampygus]
MVSSVSLRAQIASIIDALSKAAVAEISKVVEDGMVVLRLEMCQRDTEIKKLKSSVEVLHTELRAAQDRVTLRPDNPGRDGIGDQRTLLENVHPDRNHSSRSMSEAQVKSEPMDQGAEATRGGGDQLGGELALYEGSAGQWRPTTQNETGSNSSDYLDLGQNSLSCLDGSSLDAGLAVPCSSSSGGGSSGPFSRGPPACTQYHRRRPEDQSQVKTEDSPHKSEDVPPTPVQVKSEPVEENITQPLFGGGGEQMNGGGGDNLSETFTAFERDSQQWMSRLQGQNADMSSAEYLSASAQSVTSFPGMAQLLPAPVEASCSTFSFPGKPYGEIKNSMISQRPYGSIDPLLMSGENTELLETRQLMLTMPDHPPLENLAEPRTAPAAFEDQLPGGEAGGKQTVMVKVEDFQVEAGRDNGTVAPDQSQLWASGLEKRGDVTEQTVCVLLHDVKYNLSPAAAAANQQQGFSPPIKDLPFLDGKETEGVMHSDQFSVMGTQLRSSDMTLTAEIQDHDIIQEVTVSDYSTVGDQTEGRAAYEFNMTTVGHHEGCGPNTTTTPTPPHRSASYAQAVGKALRFNIHDVELKTLKFELN